MVLVWSKMPQMPSNDTDFVRVLCGRGILVYTEVRYFTWVLYHFILWLWQCYECMRNFPQGEPTNRNHFCISSSESETFFCVSLILWFNLWRKEEQTNKLLIVCSEINIKAGHSNQCHFNVHYFLRLSFVELYRSSLVHFNQNRLTTVGNVHSKEQVPSHSKHSIVVHLFWYPNNTDYIARQYLYLIQ